MLMTSDAALPVQDFRPESLLLEQDELVDVGANDCPGIVISIAVKLKFPSRR